jgi:hypothetical protein
MTSHTSQDFEKLILEEVKNTGKLNTFEFAKDLQRDHQLIVGAVKSIQSVGDVSTSYFYSSRALLSLHLVRVLLLLDLSNICCCGHNSG